MPNDDSLAEAKLRKLGKRLEMVCAKMPVLAPEQLDKVRQAVQERWQQEKLAREKSALTQGEAGNSQAQKQSKEEQQKTSTQSQSQSHGHSH